MRLSLWILSVLWVALMFGCQPPAPKDAPSKETTTAAQGAQTQPAATQPAATQPAATQASQGGGAASTSTPPATPQPGSPEFAAAAKTAGHAGCGDEPSPTPATASAPMASQHFGAPFSLTDQPIPMSDAVKRGAELNEKPVMVSAKVKTVCRKKGCWMQVDAGPDTPAVRVTFKDYGFFVPLDADGSDAIMEGSLSVNTIPEAMRKHYAQDEGKSPEEIAQITGDETSVKFTAVAVTLSRAPAAP